MKKHTYTMSTYILLLSRMDREYIFERYKSFLRVTDARCKNNAAEKIFLELLFIATLEKEILCESNIDQLLNTWITVFPPLLKTKYRNLGYSGLPDLTKTEEIDIYTLFSKTVDRLWEIIDIINDEIVTAPYKQMVDLSLKKTVCSLGYRNITCPFIEPIVEHSIKYLK